MASHFLLVFLVLNALFGFFSNIAFANFEWTRLGNQFHFRGSCKEAREFQITVTCGKLGETSSIKSSPIICSDQSLERKGYDFGVPEYATRKGNCSWWLEQLSPEKKIIVEKSELKFWDLSSSIVNYSDEELLEAINEMHTNTDLANKASWKCYLESWGSSTRVKMAQTVELMPMFSMYAAAANYYWDREILPPSEGLPSILAQSISGAIPALIYQADVGDTLADDIAMAKSRSMKAENKRYYDSICNYEDISKNKHFAYYTVLIEEARKRKILSGKNEQRFDEEVDAAKALQSQ